MRTRTSSLSSAGRAAALIAVAIVGLTGPGAAAAVTDIGGDNFPAAAVAIAHVLALATACWVLIVVICGAARLYVPGVPTSVRALLFTTVVVAAGASPALADSPHDLSGLTLPDRPVAMSAPAASEPRSVRVQPGDTVWAIAADHLPAHATNSTIADATARWYASNRQVIGPDLDLILPGQLLRPPTTEQDAS